MLSGIRRFYRVEAPGRAVDLRGAGKGARFRARLSAAAGPGRRIVTRHGTMAPDPPEASRVSLAPLPPDEAP